VGVLGSDAGDGITPHTVMTMIPTDVLTRATRVSRAVYTLVHQYCSSRNAGWITINSPEYERFRSALVGVMRRNGFSRRAAAGNRREVFLGKGWVLKLRSLGIYELELSPTQVCRIGDDVFRTEVQRMRAAQKDSELRARIPAYQLVRPKNGFPVMVQERVRVSEYLPTDIEILQLQALMHQVDCFDAHPLNMGFRRNGEWVVIDLE
jgi:hypothetical protein